MREFFKQCLEDLESLTGCRQLYFLESDLENGAKKIKVCIEGMVLASQEYPYIPEASQQKIIREQMVKDQNYESLNSRQIHKWLSMHRDKYWNSGSEKMEEWPAPAPPEVADKFIAQLQENISKIGNPEFKNGIRELRKKAGFEAGISPTQPRPEWVVGDECPECKGDGIQSAELDDSIEPQPCAICEGTGKINRMLVNADSQQEADKAYRSFKKQSV